MKTIRCLACAIVLELASHSNAQLTAAQKTAILDQHNLLRQGVSTPCTAANMQKLVWDDDLATKAQNWAATCTYATHENPKNPANSGENLANVAGTTDTSWTTTSVATMTHWWYEENVDVNWPLGASIVQPVVRSDAANCRQAESGACVIGHYTAVVNADTNKVGCGIKACSGGDWGVGGIFYVCKYLPSGNIVGPTGQLLPWITGQPCAACGGVGSANCENNLCTGNVNACIDTLSAARPATVQGQTVTSCQQAFTVWGNAYQSTCAIGSTESSCTTGTLGSLGGAGCAWVNGACSAVNIGKASYCNPSDGYGGDCDVSCDVCTTPAGIGDSYCSATATTVAAGGASATTVAAGGASATTVAASPSTTSASPSTTAGPQNQTVSGSTTMTVNDVVSFISDSNAVTAVKNAIATQTSVSATIINVQFWALRRLRSSSSPEEDSSRRLVSGSVRADYTINLPASMSAADQTTAVNNIGALTTSGLATAVTSQMNSLGLSYNATVTGVDPIATTTTIAPTIATTTTIAPTIAPTTEEPTAKAGTAGSVAPVLGGSTLLLVLGILSSA